MSADLFERLFADMARVFAPVEPGDFATARAVSPPPPEATPPTWAHPTHEGTEL